MGESSSPSWGAVLSHNPKSERLVDLSESTGVGLVAGSSSKVPSSLPHCTGGDQAASEWLPQSLLQESQRWKGLLHWLRAWQRYFFLGSLATWDQRLLFPLGLEKRLFFKDPCHLFPDLVARLPSAAGLVRNMRKPG